MTEDARRLLAGYATNTLTEAERQALFAAALEDGELFSALSNEQALRELLDDPAARHELLKRIEPAQPGFVERLTGWMTRPAVLAGSGAVALALVLVSVLPVAQDQPQQQTALAPAQVVAERQPAPGPAAAEEKPAPASERKQAVRRFTAPAAKLSTPPEPQTLEPLAELRTDLNVGQLQRSAPAPARPATAGAHLVRSEAAAKPAVLSYEVAVLSEDRTWTVVGPDTPLANGSVVRVRILSTEAGTLTDGKAHWRIAPERPHEFTVRMAGAEQRLEFALIPPVRAGRAAFTAQTAMPDVVLPARVVVTLRPK